MKQLAIATQNKHKIIELKRMLEPLGYVVLTLYDFPELGSIIEDGETYQENALIKAKTLSDHAGVDAIADDSGLDVFALDGAPGVHSARYAGDDVTYDDNNRLLLSNMQGVADRRARFVTTICLYRRGEQPRYFTGHLHGEIATEYKGTNGFGFDPIFRLPDGRHLAELAMDEKNAISHRAIALGKLIDYLHPF